MWMFDFFVFFVQSNFKLYVLQWAYRIRTVVPRNLNCTGPILPDLPICRQIFFCSLIGLHCCARKTEPAQKNKPGLRVCVYPTPTRQELLTLACVEKTANLECPQTGSDKPWHHCMSHNCETTHGTIPYRKRGILIQLIFGSHAEECVVASSRPSQVDRSLRFAVHLLVNRAGKFCAIVAATERQSECWKEENHQDENDRWWPIEWM